MVCIGTLTRTTRAYHLATLLIGPNQFQVRKRVASEIGLDGREIRLHEVRSLYGLHGNVVYAHYSSQADRTLDLSALQLEEEMANGQRRKLARVSVDGKFRDDDGHEF
jgi:hypothetical protein